MKTLILTEKPSVARDFAKALKINSRNLENENYVIVAAVGHLLELFDPEDYDPKWKKWALGNLPILPETFQYSPIHSSRDVLERIQKQISRKEVEKIIIATDAGREGELIARTILCHCGQTRKPAYRFWTSQALTEEVVLEGLKKIKPAKDYERLFFAGQGRQFADWLVGMNLSRAATKRFGDLFSVGRVQTAVLSLVVARRKEIDFFKPEPYWVIQAHFKHKKTEQIYSGSWFNDEIGKLKSKAQADEIIKKISNKEGCVFSVQKQNRKLDPPQLFSLTELQKEANKRFGLTAQKTLDCAQNLYENHKCLSYPRSDSVVMGSKNVDLVRSISKKLSSQYPDLFKNFKWELISLKNTRIFNDKKLTDHHALIPLSGVPGRATEDEKKVFELVLKRFVAAFYPSYEFKTTEVITKVDDEFFRSKGKIVKAKGWKEILDDRTKEVVLPELKKSDSVFLTQAEQEEKSTTPPSEYNEASLLGDMSNPGKYVDEKELKSVFRTNVGLGTQSTRASIIEKLIHRKYLKRVKKNLVATSKGCVFIDLINKLSLTRRLAHPKESARWEQTLEQIAVGQASYDEFLNEIKVFIRDSVNEFRTFEYKRPRCPLCGAVLIRGNKTYGCSRWKEGCRYILDSEKETSLEA